MEHLIKSRDDYRVAEFMVRNTRYEPLYEEFLQERERIGGLHDGSFGLFPA